jgi:hypothetical protein
MSVERDRASWAQGSFENTATLPTATELPPAVRQFRLACGCPDEADVTSFMRGLGPLQAMVRQDSRLQLIRPPRGESNWGWDWLSGTDALFLQRPASPLSVQIALQARLMGLPVWIDWDDDLPNISRCNPSFKLVDRDMLLKVSGALIKLADVVTTSTEQLRTVRMTALSAPEQVAAKAKIHVLSNALHWRNSDLRRNRNISWRGSAHHAENLAAVLPAISAVASSPKYTGWKWSFMGDTPWQIFEAIPRDRLETKTPLPIHPYIEAYFSRAPWIHLVPLADNSFNRCKSNLAWIEATAAGAVVLAPDWAEWQKPGIIRYSQPADFATKLEEALDHFGNGEIHPGVSASRDYVASHLTLRHTNSLRWGILRRFCNKPADQMKITTPD